MEDIHIERNVPVPEARQGIQKYPWHEMKPGDSFVVPLERMDGARYAGRAWCARHKPEWMVVTRKTEDNSGLRIWFAEKPVA